MAFLVIPLLAAIAVAVLAIYRYILSFIRTLPLRRIPSAHWSAPFSPLWILWHRQQQSATPAVHAAHARHGAIVRLAPAEISVNCVDGGIRTIYGGGFDKGAWYTDGFNNYGVSPMFAMERVEHARRKRLVSNIYAKTTIQGSEALAGQTELIVRERLFARLRDGDRDGDGDGGNGNVVEMYDVFSAATMDFVTAYIFGRKNGSDFLREMGAGRRLFRSFKARQKFTFWKQEMPQFTTLLQRLGLRWLVVPRWVDAANDGIEDWVAGLCDRAEKTLDASAAVSVEDTPTVYRQLRDGLSRERAAETGGKGGAVERTEEFRRQIASELLDHTLAGFDTSGISLTWLAWQLSRPENLDWQLRLRREIATLDGSLDPRAIDSLPVLHAILMESLRLHAALGGNQPRVTPSTSAVILGDGVVVPPGIRVQSQAHSLHRNPDVFPDPEAWRPQRWLGEGDTREMLRWFWAFSSGGRMCVGSNLAMLDMKAIIVGVWGSFATEIVCADGMVPNGGYMSEPLGVGSSGRIGHGEDRTFLTCRLTQISKT